MAPILDADGVAAYLGVQVDVTSSVIALARAEKDGVPQCRLCLC